MLEVILITAIILITILINNLQFITASFFTPKGYIYLGTVHSAGDYFSYLAEMAQGKYYLLYSRILHTAEKLPLTLVGWPYVLWGRICAIFRIEVIIGYQIAMLIFLLLFLLLSYKLIFEIFPNTRGKRILAFFFFAASTAMVKLSFDHSGITGTVYDYWYNTGNAMTRFGHTPHHVLANTLAVLILLLVILWMRKKIGLIGQIGLIAGISLAGLLLSSITPVHWGLVAGTVGIAVAVQAIFNGFRVDQFIPIIAVLLGGLPAFLYLKKAFTVPPYLQGTAWEAYNQLPVNLSLLVKGSGLVFPLMFIGLFAFFRRVNFPRILGVVFIGFCALFYFSKIPLMLHLTNARFWPSTVYIFIAAVSSDGLYLLSGLLGKFKKSGLAVLLMIYLISIVPSYVLQFRESLKPQLGNAFVYIPSDVYDTYKQAQNLSGKDDLFLVAWPYNLPFPAISGRRTFYGYNPTTVDYEKKEKETYNFFANQLTEGEMQEFLVKNRIDYVVGNWWSPKVDKLKNLTRIYRSPTLAIDKVER